MIVRCIRENYDDYDGFVVTYGKERQKIKEKRKNNEKTFNRNRMRTGRLYAGKW